MKLPKLSHDEIRALRAPGDEELSELAERISAHLAANLAAHVRVDARVISTALRIQEGDLPRMRADDELLTAWVAARFGSVGVNQVVPAYLGESLLAKIRQALAEVVLREKLGEASSLCLEITMNSQHGRLELDWSDMSASALKDWAMKQWAAR